MTFKANNAVYRDTGCSLHPSCLECPREVCKYDDPQYSSRGLNNERRNEYILELRKRGVPVGNIASQLKLSQRTIHRVLSDR